VLKKQVLNSLQDAWFETNGLFQLCSALEGQGFSRCLWINVRILVASEMVAIGFSRAKGLPTSKGFSP